MTAWFAGVEPKVQVEERSRHVRRISFDLQLLVRMALSEDGTLSRKMEDAPDDLEIVEIRISPDYYNRVDVIVRSETFGWVSPSSTIPDWHPVWSARYIAPEEENGA